MIYISFMTMVLKIVDERNIVLNHQILYVNNFVIGEENTCKKDG